MARPGDQKESAVIDVNVFIQRFSSGTKGFGHSADWTSKRDFSRPQKPKAAYNFPKELPLKVHIWLRTVHYFYFPRKVRWNQRHILVALRIVSTIRSVTSTFRTKRSKMAKIDRSLWSVTFALFFCLIFLLLCRNLHYSLSQPLNDCNRLP